MENSHPRVHGINLDPQTRCLHYRSVLDVIAIKMYCCGEYYACKDCHDAIADHILAVWPQREWNQPAVLCGVCHSEMSVEAYLQCESRCPACKISFNPGCRNHAHFYFEKS